jgi:hypothetical protein
MVFFSIIGGRVKFCALWVTSRLISSRSLASVAAELHCCKLRHVLCLWAAPRNCRLQRDNTACIWSV